MLGKIAGILFEKIIGGFLKAWESNKRDATNIEKGADKVVKAQLEDEVEKAKRANEIEDEVREKSDEELDDLLRKPSERKDK